MIEYEDVFDAVARDMNEGFCTNKECQSRHDGIEPDAKEYRCPVCNEFSVYGAEELLIMLDNKYDWWK